VIVDAFVLGLVRRRRKGATTSPRVGWATVADGGIREPIANVACSLYVVLMLRFGKALAAVRFRS